MIKVKSLLLLILFGAVLNSGCKKQEVYDPQQQLAAEDQSIKSFISTNNITAEKHTSGIYFQKNAPGNGSFTYTANTKVTVKYVGRLLNGQIFDQNSAGVTFTLGNLILGWQIGIPLIQKGGKIRLLIPSVYAYGAQAQSGIPANSALDFEIELIDVF